MVTWTNSLPTPEPAQPLTDEQIIRVCMQTMRRYRPALGIGLSSKIAAARMRRLYARGGAR